MCSYIHHATALCSQYTALPACCGSSLSTSLKNALLPKLLTEMIVHVCIKIYMQQGYMQLQGLNLRDSHLVRPTLLRDTARRNKPESPDLYKTSSFIFFSTKRN